MPNPDEQNMNEYIQKLWNSDPISDWDEVHGEPVLVPVKEEQSDDN